MAPIRIGIIGLSSSAKTAWAAGAHLPYLLSSRGRSKYEIVALCNSSVEAAKKAISSYGLNTNTRAYGDPEKLADDKDVDLVVCCTRVDVHYETILPSVKAGKSVFVEWPLAQDVAQAGELATAAKDSESRTMVGIQGRVAPVVVKLRSLLENNRIGKILSSEVRAAGGTVDRETLSSGLKYFTDKAIGGNVYTIGFGHLFDQVQTVLGEFSGLRGRFQIQRPAVKIRNGQTQSIVETVQSNVPDLFIATARLPASNISQADSSVLLRFRRGQPFKGEAPLVWSINGERGEIRLTAWGSSALGASGYDKPVTIEIHHYDTDELEAVEWGWEDWQTEFRDVGRSVAMLYEKFAEGDKEGVPSFDDALKRHRQLNDMFDQDLNQPR